MKKYLYIASLLGILAFAAPALAQNVTFDNNLTLGSAGQYVSDLQTWLMSNGFDIPAISSGSAVKGYFGLQTQSAVAAYQRSVGLPAFGFFGPMTRGWIRDHGNGQRGESLAVTSPNGGETWTTGSTHDVTWTTSPGLAGQTADIKLEFPMPACAQPGQPIRCMIMVRAPLTIASGVSLGSGSYAWMVGAYAVPPCLSGYTCDPVSISPGQYKIQICPTNSSQCDDNDGYFTIASSSTSSLSPVISGVDAPTSLAINQTGTWTVHATDPLNGTLSYSVDWGDEDNRPVGSAAASVPQVSQTTSFAHSYSIPGKYAVTFTVSNIGGLSSKTTSTVSVTGTNMAGPLKITSPNGGEAWILGTTHNITWISPYYFSATTADLKIVQQFVCTTPACPAIAYAPYTIAAGIPINQDSYSWNVGSFVSSGEPTCPNCGINYSAYYGQLPSGQYKVMICQSGTNVCDSSDTAFTIASSSVSSVPDINIISPNGGEIWQSGSTQNVTVDITGPAGQIGDYVQFEITDSTGIVNGNGFGLNGQQTGGAPGVKTFQITLPSGWKGQHKLYVALDKSNTTYCPAYSTCSLPPTLQAYDYSDGFITIQ